MYSIPGNLGASACSSSDGDCCGVRMHRSLMGHSKASVRQLGVPCPGSMRDDVILVFAGCTAQPLSAPALAPMQPLDAPATLEGAASMTAPAPAPEEPLQAAAPVAAPVQVPATHNFLLRPEEFPMPAFSKAEDRLVLQHCCTAYMPEALL